MVNLVIHTMDKKLILNSKPMVIIFSNNPFLVVKMIKKIKFDNAVFSNALIETFISSKNKYRIKEHRSYQRMKDEILNFNLSGKVFIDLTGITLRNQRNFEFLIDVYSKSDLVLILMKKSKYKTVYNMSKPAYLNMYSHVALLSYMFDARKTRSSNSVIFRDVNGTVWDAEMIVKRIDINDWDERYKHKKRNEG